MLHSPEMFSNPHPLIPFSIVFKKNFASKGVVGVKKNGSKVEKIGDGDCDVLGGHR